MNLPSRNDLPVLSFRNARTERTDRRFAEEMPVAFEYNGFGYAVMMATPRALADFALGFSLSEGLIETADELQACTEAEVDGGRILRLSIPEERMAPLRERVRLRLTEGSCGLCGLQSIEKVLRPLPRLIAKPQINADGLEAALGSLSAHQPLGRATGAMHAAAFCAADGRIVAAREDVGRHNALDKLVGHLAHQKIDPASGFILLSARCSYELVDKTVRAGCPALATISAPSDLAVTRAREAGLTLLALARSDSALIASDPHGLFS
ncbi:formate dehydrogenase accessory sulfurtransferase FdhD [Qipengyuania algicida]|nr:formate dehydrogenase accessory sulfurtransferase FdhD [Qipengyuania algicida]